MAYDESKHPRGYHGRWGNGNGVSPDGTVVMAGGQRNVMVGPKAKTPGPDMPFVHVEDPNHLEYANRLSHMANRVALAQGFPPTKIGITDNDKQFALNGQMHEAAGMFFSQHGSITLFLNHLSGGSAEDTLNHEIMHAKYDAFQTDVHDEEKAFRLATAFDTNEATRPSHGPSAGLPIGKLTLTPEEAAKFPLLDKYNEWSKTTDPEKMKAEDGNTPYSKMWWDEYAKVPPTGTAATMPARFDNPINETLAEMAAVKLHAGDSTPRGAEGPPLMKKWDDGTWHPQGEPSKSWEQLYQMVDDNWNTKHKPKAKS